MEGGREIKHLAAAGVSDSTILCVNFWHLWASKHGFRALATVRLLRMQPTACTIEHDWATWYRLYTKQCSRPAPHDLDQGARRS